MFGSVRQWRKGEWDLVFLLVASLILKLLILSPGHVINPDGVRYIDAARQFAEGNFRAGLHIDNMPFYSLLMVAFHYLVQDWALSGQLISLISLVLAVIPLYWLTRGIFDQKAAFWAGLAFILSPMLNGLSIDLFRDPIFLCFVTWSVYFFWRSATDHRYLFYMLTSFSAIIAVFCRIEGVFLFAIFLPFLLVLAIKNRTERRSLFKGMAVLVGLPLLLGLGLGIFLWGFAGVELTSVIRLEEIQKRLRGLINGNFLSMYHFLYAQLKSFQNPNAYWSTGSFAETARHYLPLIYIIGLLEAMSKNLFLLYVIPLWAGLRKCPAFKRGHWLLLSVAVGYFLVVYYFLFTHDFISKRYVLVPALMLYPWVGRGLGRIRYRIAATSRPGIAMGLFLIIFCGVPVYKSLREVARPDKGHFLKVAGSWLSSEADLRGDVLAGSDPRIRLYSSQELNFLNGGEAFSIFRDFDQTEKVALEKNVDLLILEISQKRRDQVPQFKHYSLQEEFADEEKVVLIYRRINQVAPGPDQSQQSKE